MSFKDFVGNGNNSDLDLKNKMDIINIIDYIKGINNGEKN